MLTNNFLKTIMTLNGDQTGIDIANTEQFIYANNSNYTTVSTYTLGYNVGESTQLFLDEDYAYTYEDLVEPNTLSNGATNAFYSSNTYAYKSTLAILVGTGTTPPASSDYKLENQVVLESVNDSCTMDPTGMISLTREFKNNTGAQVTINEIGMYVVSGRGRSNYTPHVFLIGRKLLDSPVTLNVNEIASFQYRIDLSV